MFKRKADTSPSSDAKKPKTDSSITSFFGQPKITPAAHTAADNSSQPEANGKPPTFDKEKWVATLSPEVKDLLKLEIETLDPSWLAHLKDDITSSSFLDLKRWLAKEISSGKKIYPPMNDVYSWSRHTPLHTVKVVIIGQDPYMRPNQAHGLSFSVRPPTPAPPSLKNMYIALAKDYPSFKPPPKNGGLLTPWADQGILLLNTLLTVQAGEPLSHQNRGWEQFTQRVIDIVVKVRTRGVVFLAWGKPAQQRCAKVSGARHLVLRAVHPSPRSANLGFFDCGHFKKTNEFLQQKYGKDGIIDWSLEEKEAEIKPPAGKQVGDKQKVTASQKEPEPKPKPAALKKAETDEFEEEDALEALRELAENDAVQDQGENKENVNTDGATVAAKIEAKTVAEGKGVEEVKETEVEKVEAGEKAD